MLLSTEWKFLVTTYVRDITVVEGVHLQRLQPQATAYPATRFCNQIIFLTCQLANRVFIVLFPQSTMV